MDRIGTHGRRGAAGGPDRTQRLRLRGTLDFSLLFLFAFVAQVSAAHGVSAAEDDGLLFYPDVLAPLQEGESPSLDMGAGAASARALLSRFSQNWDAPVGDPDRFHLSQTTPPSAQQATGNPVAATPIRSDQATTAQFGGDFRTLRDRLVAAMDSAPEAERDARRLDVAQALIARMMLPEARGAVRDMLARGAALSAADRDRALGYERIIARLMSGATAILPPAWAGDPLWPVLVAGQPVADATLRAAMAGLSEHSREVATAALPLLFDMALAGGDAVTAAEILTAAPAGTDLDGTGTLDLMRGRLALAQGAEDMAFEAFARLAEGDDQAAAEARVAMADLALSRKDAALLPQVRQLLQDGMPRWRGDATALRLRVRLARVAEDMGDIPTAMEVMSAIHHEHPDTPEAELAQDRIGVMIDRLTSIVTDGATPLADAIASVRRLDGAMAGRGGWVAVRVALAQRLEDASLTEAAKAEYAAIAEMPFATLQAADPAVMDRATVAHAALLLDSGKRAAALSVLDRRTYPRGSAQMDRHAALRLAAGRTAMLPGLLLSALKVEDAAKVAAADVQLALADVALTAGQDDAALVAFDRGLPAADEARRLTAGRLAGEAGDADRATRFAQSLDTDRAPLQRAVVQSLAAPRLSGKRLSVSGASALIETAKTAGASVDALLAQGPTP